LLAIFRKPWKKKKEPSDSNPMRVYIEQSETFECTRLNSLQICDMFVKMKHFTAKERGGYFCFFLQFFLLQSDLAKWIECTSAMRFIFNSRSIFFFIRIDIKDFWLIMLLLSALQGFLREGNTDLVICTINIYSLNFCTTNIWYIALICSESI
jgi:hypothetical protein